MHVNVIFYEKMDYEILWLYSKIDINLKILFIAIVFINQNWTKHKIQGSIMLTK